MNAVEIKKDVYWVGVKNPGLKVFDIIMTTEKGTTYNSYLIVDEKVVLVDTVKDGFFDEFIDRIKSVIGDRAIDYIVVNHTEPDHSGSLFRILDAYKDAVVVASKSALINIKQIINRDFKGIEAKGDLNIGKRTLKFISAPFLHWPDTIFTYDQFDKVIFTCDAFGCHYCGEGLFNDNAGEFSDQFAYYFNVIMGPFKKYIVTAVDRIRELDFEVIAPSHGPIHRENPRQYVKYYEEHSKSAVEKHDEKYALVLYVSAYGYTRDIAYAIGEGAKKAGFQVEIIDVSEADINQVIEKVDRSNILFIGSPTINQDAVKPVWDVLSLVSPLVNRGKLAAAFGSFGWSGEAVGLLNDRLKGLKLKVIEPGFKVTFKPTKEDIERAENFANDIGKMI